MRKIIPVTSLFIPAAYNTLDQTFSTFFSKVAGVGRKVKISRKLRSSAWSEAARIVFAMSLYSASCGRVFALLKNMFGDEQMSSLADYIQAALMLH